MLVQLNNSPISDDVVGSRGHAIDAPVRVPVIVADGDAESAVVCSDHIDEESRLTFDL